MFLQPYQEGTLSNTIFKKHWTDNVTLSAEGVQ